MFVLWPIFLPAKITFVLLTGLVIVATIVAQVRNRRGVRAFGLGLGIAVVAFVPCCGAVNAITYSHHIGVFEFPDFESTSNRFARIFLPNTATNITIDQGINRHLARFAISKAQVEIWLDGQWERRGKSSIKPRASTNGPRDFGPDWCVERARALNWRIPLDLTAYDVPYSASGATATIIFSESEGTAYEVAYYW